MSWPRSDKRNPVLALYGHHLYRDTPVFVTTPPGRAFHLYRRFDTESGYGYLPACRPGMSVFGTDLSRAMEHGLRLCIRCRRIVKKGADAIWM